METSYMKYIVYQTTNKVNGKLYVGVHKTKNPNVWDKYIGGGIYVGNQLKNPKTVYQHALKKYGYENFIRTVLFTYDTEDEAYDKEADIVNIEWVKSKNTYNSQTGGLSEIYRGKYLYQFDLKGNLIKEWPQYKEAVEYFGVGHCRFRDAIIGKYSTCESYWNDKPTINVSEYKIAYHSEVYQFTQSGEFVKCWKSATEASKELGYPKKSVQDAVRTKKLYKQFWWVKDKDTIFDIIKYRKEFSIQSNIEACDINENVIEEFYGIKQASKFFNIKYDVLKHAIKSGKRINGLLFRKTSKISVATKIKQYDLEGNLIKIWDSITQCAKQYPKCREVLKGCRTHTHGYKFEYIL